jgi:hypothetical protein
MAESRSQNRESKTEMAVQPGTTPTPADSSPVTRQPVAHLPEVESTSGGRIAAVAAMVVLLAVVLLQLYRVTPPAGQFRDFAYTQDKAYVDLLVARELTGQSVGPNRFACTTPLASTASPGWTVVLGAVMRTLGRSPEDERGAQIIALIPLGLNVISAAVLVLLVGHLVRREVTSGFWMFVLLVGMGLLMPLSLVVLAGTEHLLHAVMMLAAIAVGIATIERDESSLLLIVASALAAAANISLRPEGLAALVGVVLWAWIRQRTSREMLALLTGVGLVAGMGFYLVSHGAAAVQDPVLLHARGLLSQGWKGVPAHLLEAGRHGASQAGLPWTLLLVAAGLLVALRGQTHSPVRAERERVAWLFIFVVVAVAYTVSGRTDGHYWHEAYLLPIGFVAIGRAVAACVKSDWLRIGKVSRDSVAQDARATCDGPPWYRGAALIVVVCLVPLAAAAIPTLKAFARTSAISRDALVRDRAAAAFVRTYFSAGPVATNRPGVIGYETNARVVDVSGVMNHELAMARLRGEYAADMVGRTVERGGAQLALIAGETPDVAIPPQWKPLGGWYRRDNAAGRDSDSAVRVYAVSSAMESDARIALRLLSESPQPVPGMEYWFVEEVKTPTSRGH